ncbi:DUF1611 domain-containing protein [Micromonospora sp. DH14]|uniref:DUF1611 domain-containing protein n=1 Tax=Micromonospora sp. DH14 TaxID=3040120 RepID=UPI0024428155|nr:DUF1611 domain-containing protein [Micromonospora sp. DH14]MDG9679002.1 DUF1611 domain-containing protein [Micromonospora sp. DH14]
MVDAVAAGTDAGVILGVGALDVPVVPDLASAARAGARSVVVGVNAMDADSHVPPRLRAFVVEAIAEGLDVVCATHAHLNDDPELKARAASAGARLVDVRTEGPRHTWSPGLRVDATVVLTVGTDSAVGKMTTALLLHRAALAAGLSSGFVATGQIGNMCGADEVVHADHTFGDFIIGAVQRAVHRLAVQGRQIIVVEGQGAILHRAYGGGIINILFGAAPDAIIMCHHTDRVDRAMFPGLKVSSVADELAVIEDLSRRVGISARLAGFSIFGSRPCDEAARYGVPVVNVRDEGSSDILLRSVLDVTASGR